jgi:Phage integrase, N-terminal SAM-like domain
MSPLRTRMIDAMTLAGLAQGTQDSYVGAVRKLAAFYRRSPEQLSEEEVRAYLLDLRRRGAARGTFEIARAGLRFLFCQTLDQVWALFGEKKDRLAAAEAAA